MYVERRASGELATWVTHRWDEAAEHSGGADHAVVPDSSMDLVWTGAQLLVLGPETRATVWSDPPPLLVGLRLRPGAAASLVGETADRLRDQRVPLERLWGSYGREAAAIIASAPGAALALEEVVLRRGRSVRPPDRLTSIVLGRLREGRTTGEIAREVGLSERHLRRRFVQQVGYGPKRLLRLMRVQRVLALARSRPSANLAALAVAAGYADQSHLTREFRELTGATPSRLIASRRRS